MFTLTFFYLLFTLPSLLPFLQMLFTSLTLSFFLISFYLWSHTLLWDVSKTIFYNFQLRFDSRESIFLFVYVGVIILVFKNFRLYSNTITKNLETCYLWIKPGLHTHIRDFDLWKLLSKHKALCAWTRRFTSHIYKMTEKKTTIVSFFQYIRIKSSLDLNTQLLTCYTL